MHGIFRIFILFSVLVNCVLYLLKFLYMSHSESWKLHLLIRAFCSILDGHDLQWVMTRLKA